MKTYKECEDCKYKEAIPEETREYCTLFNTFIDYDLLRKCKSMPESRKAIFKKSLEKHVKLN